MHGMVVLEVFEHTSFIGEHQAEIFRMAMRDLLEDVHRRIPAQRAMLKTMLKPRGSASGWRA